MPSPHLDLPDWTGGQDHPEIPVNDQRDGLDRAMNEAATIALADADYSLTAQDQQERGFLTFTGALTADRNITLLAGKDRQITVENATTGGFNLVVKYAVAGNTVAISPGRTVTIQGDGTNVKRSAEPDVFAYAADAVPQGGLDYVLVRRSTDGDLVKVLLDDLPGSGSVGIAGGGLGPLLHVVDKKTAGTNAGASSSATTHIRVLQTILTNGIPGASLASNQITLPAGKYLVLASAPAYRSNNHGAWLYNVTDAANQLIGTPEATTSTDAVQTRSFIRGEIEIPAQKVFEIRHFFNAGHADGLGVAHGQSDVIFTEVMIWQILETSASAQTNDATPIELWSLMLAVGETASVEAVVNAKKATGEIYSARIFQTARNAGGTTTVGAQDRQEIELGTVTAGVDASLVADDTTNTIKLEVTGAAAATWDWSASVRVVRQ